LELNLKTAKSFIAGDTEAVNDVYNEYRKLLFFIIVSITKNEQDANDVFQTVFTEILENPPRHIKPEKLQQYLCESAKNQAINFIKKRDALIDYSDLLDIYGEEDCDNSFMQSLLSGLSDVENTIIVYKIVYDFSYREISSLTGLSRQNCINIYKRALIKMRKLYGDNPYAEQK